MKHMVAIFLLLALTACAAETKDKISGERVPVLGLKAAAPLQAEETGVQPTLPAELENLAWPQVMGLPDQPLANSALDAKPKERWRTSIGDGAAHRARLLSRPVVADGLVVAMDSTAHITALNLRDGSQQWTRDLAPADAEETQFGGGAAIDGGTVFASTGYGEVVALRLADGGEVWRANVRGILRAAPMVYQGRVFVMTTTGQLQALDAASGQVLWVHSGIAESTGLLGNSTPVIAGDVVLAAYNSGELYAVRVQNGRTVWSQSLVSTVTRGAAPAMADIKASPAVDDERVYAISHDGRMAAIDMRTGNAVWDVDSHGVDTPVLAGDAVFVLADSQNLLSLDRATGRVRAARLLAAHEDESDKDSLALRWTGPVLAGGRLWLVNNAGTLAAFDALTLEPVYTDSLGAAATLAPVVAQQTLLVLTDDGDVVAYR